MRRIALDVSLRSLLHACAAAALLAVPACASEPSSEAGSDVGTESDSSDDYGDCTGWYPPDDIVLMNTGTLVSLTRSGNFNHALMAEGSLVSFDGYGTEELREIPATTNVRAWVDLQSGGYRVVVGDGGAILVTSGAGTEWQIIDAGITDDLLDVVAAPDGSWVLAIASTRMLYSDDSGMTWTELSPGTWTGLQQMFWAAGQLWLLGESGEVWTASDPTGVWESVELDVDGQPLGGMESNCMDCVVILGQSGLHLRNTGGAWAFLPPPDGETFTAIGGGYITTDRALYEFHPATGLSEVAELDVTPIAVVGDWEFAIIAGSAGELVRVQRIVCLGRPWMVAGVSATAKLEREAASDRWVRDGLYEHASVASFARFVSELLALGAPPALVRDAQAAILDELEHARLCFELAAREHGRVQPGPLPLDTKVTARAGDPVALALALFEEGCVGETIAAVEAGVSAATSEDADVRRTLERIAVDERRHAALAWRTLRWLIDEFGEPVRAALRSKLSTLGRGGDEVRMRTIAELIRPLAAALLGPSSTQLRC